MRRLRQERDPHFGKGARAGKGQQPAPQRSGAGAEATPSQPGRMGPPPPKRKKGLGFEVQLPACASSALCCIFAADTARNSGSVLKGCWRPCIVLVWPATALMPRQEPRGDKRPRTQNGGPSGSAAAEGGAGVQQRVAFASAGAQDVSTMDIGEPMQVQQPVAHAEAAAQPQAQVLCLVGSPIGSSMPATMTCPGL